MQAHLVQLVSSVSICKYELAAKLSDFIAFLYVWS